MGLQRRLLPSMSALSAFEAAARTGSFTVAARELALTQGAVSRQVRALEELVGRPLFLRSGQRVELTPAGQTYAEQIREALHRIGSATLNAIAAPQGGILKLAILPTFGTCWLVPRLPGFQAAHPGIIIHFTTKVAPFDFRQEDLDGAIHFGDADWPNAICDRLLAEQVLPVCSPAFLDQHPVAAPAELAALPLLHATTRPEAWDEWFAAQGAPRTPGAGMFFEHFATVREAALAGLGVALLPLPLMDAELTAGALVPVLDRPYDSGKAYYLVHPPDRTRHPPLAAFRRWLLGEVAGASAVDEQECRHTLIGPSPACGRVRAAPQPTTFGKS